MLPRRGNISLREVKRWKADPIDSARSEILAFHRDDVNSHRRIERTQRYMNFTFSSLLPKSTISHPWIFPFRPTGVLSQQQAPYPQRCAVRKVKYCKWKSKWARAENDTALISAALYGGGDSSSLAAVFGIIYIHFSMYAACCADGDCP